MRKVFVFALVLTVGLAGAPAAGVAATVGSISAQAEAAGKLVGVLKDGTGKPVQNATVNVLDRSGKVVGSVATDANGLFSVGNLPVGSYSIHAIDAAGQVLVGASSISVAAGATTTLTATVTATGTLAVASGNAGFLAALGGPIAAAALASAGVVGAVAIQQAVKDASPSR
jgi:Carboxypeptidase regulatory-like domain